MASRASGCRHSPTGLRLLVTGRAGHIESICAFALLDAQHEVAVLNDLSVRHRDAVPPAARFIKGRVHDAGRLIDDQHDVLHFPAESLVGESVPNLELSW